MIDEEMRLSAKEDSARRARTRTDSSPTEQEETPEAGTHLLEKDSRL